MHIRVEHWANALHQPQTAAAAMLGRDAVYDRVPYFYTDQYDLGMEYAGYAGPGFFVNSQTNRGNLIYHRYNGHYGLITPPAS